MTPEFLEKLNIKIVNPIITLLQTGEPSMTTHHTIKIDGISVKINNMKPKP